jgi:glycosyltransferase involved in cell wall biosynthesis
VLANNPDLMSNNLSINLSFLLSKATGITIYAKNLLPYLKFLNPTLLSAQNHPEFRCQKISANLTPAQGVKGHLNRLVWTQFKLPKIYKSLKSQLLFSPIPEAPLHSNCRFVVMAHDLIPLRFPKRFSLLTPYNRYYVPNVLAQSQHILCNSHATAKDIANFCNIPASKITPIPLAYDRNNFNFLNLPTSNYFLYIGRQDAYKNLHRVISAFAVMTNKSYELWLVGGTDPRCTPNLQTHIKELGINDRVKFLEYVSYSELPTIINQAISLVFPSLWEGFGLPILEAMACGTPVITSHLASMPEVAGDAAILVDPYNVAEISNAMKMVAEDFQLQTELRQAGLIRAQQFSWEKTGTATAEVLKQYL